MGTEKEAVLPSIIQDMYINPDCPHGATCQNAERLRVHSLALPVLQNIMEIRNPHTIPCREWKSTKAIYGSSDTSLQSDMAEVIQREKS
jgi:hypothetical protein